ncbi:MAG: hypothetical protein AB7V42_01045 [Thermoleophilia bacterium]
MAASDRPRRLRRLAAALILAALAAGALTASQASAQSLIKLQGKKWPGGVVRYALVNVPDSYRPVIKEAVRQWNISGAKIRLKPVPIGGAQLLIRHRTGLPDSGPNQSAGLATYGPLGGRGRRARAFIHLDLRSLDPVGNVAVVVHEFGHVLGLPHPNKLVCTVMRSPIVFQFCPKSPDPDYEICNFVREIDWKSVGRRYGYKKPKPVGADFCLKGPPPAAPAPPADLTYRVAPLGGGKSDVVLTWTPWQDTSYHTMDVSIVRGTCAAPDPASPPNTGSLDSRTGSYRWTTATGGVWCWQFTGRTYSPFNVVSDKFGLAPATWNLEVRT